MQPTHIGRRAFATCLDYAVCFILSYLYIWYAGEPTDTGHSVQGIAALVPVLYWFVYFVVGEALLSATPGHVALGLKVVRLDGRRIDFIDSLKRHLLDPVDFFFYGIPAIITIKNTAHAQRIGDIWAHTRVVLADEEPAQERDSR